MDEIIGRIKQVFQKNDTHKALVAYITASDPNFETTLELMRSLAANGADIIELACRFLPRCWTAPPSSVTALPCQTESL
ncbi:tryptophan synthase subunit alpha [Helicobacter pametensis]|nr:tryptophan synthase subunit alpha [Helicobacter pametensis]